MITEKEVKLCQNISSTCETSHVNKAKLAQHSYILEEKKKPNQLPSYFGSAVT